MKAKVVLCVVLMIGLTLSVLIEDELPDIDEDFFLERFEDTSQLIGDLQDNVPCPTTNCSCSKDSTMNKYLINCRYQQLKSLPLFTRINVSYYELTFSRENYLTRLPAYGFSNLTVERIDLRRNSLKTIESYAFSGLEPYLKELLLEGNGKSSPPYQEISRLNKLKRLWLQAFDQDKIDVLNNFDSWPLLEELYLYQFPYLTQIHSQAFSQKLPKLRHLDLTGLGLSTIPVESLSNLYNLQKLLIKETVISRVYSHSFERLHQLTELDLSYNKISILDRDVFVGVVDTLIHLDLRFNKLTDESLVALSSKTWYALESLTLSYNTNLKKLSDRIFTGMGKLNYLNIVDIGLERVSDGLLTGLTSLHALDLSSNNIQTISQGAFAHTPSLAVLRLSWQFESYRQLKPADMFLHLSQSSLSSLPSSLKELELQNSPLVDEELWPSLRTLPNLTTINLIKTGITNIPQLAFYNNRRLKVIDVSENDIRSLHPASFWGLQQSLTEIFFQGCNLTTIDLCVFQNFTQLQKIELSYNPLNCDCNMEWFHDWIQNKSISSYHFFKEQYICSTPPKFADQPLCNIPREDLTCDTRSPGDKQRCQNYDSLIPSSTTESTSSSSTNKPRNLLLTLASSTSSSLTVAWHLDDKTDVTRYLLKFSSFNSVMDTTLYIHRENFLKVIEDLQSGHSYNVCLTVEIDLQLSNVQICQVFKTKNKQSDSESMFDGTKPTDVTTTTVTVVAVVGVVGFVILAIIVINFTIKYKFRKLKTLELTMTRQQPRTAGCSASDMADCKMSVTPNEYTETGAAGRSLESDNPYHTFQSVRTDAIYNMSQTYASCQDVDYYNSDTLPHRHSAPSRLDAMELMKYNARPLPATPRDFPGSSHQIGTTNTVARHLPITPSEHTGSASMTDSANQIAIPVLIATPPDE